MPSVLTTKFRIHNAKSFKEGFNEGPEDGSLSTNIYTGIGKITPWLDNNSEPDLYSGAEDTTSDQNPPNPPDHIQGEYQVWRNMIAAKKIEPNDVKHVIPRFNYIPDRKYSKYRDLDDTLLYDYINDETLLPFYVVTEEFNVYKCLYNADNGQSTIQPTGTGEELIFPGDGYIWKYMYTINPGDAFKFMTEDYIPVPDILLEQPDGGGICSPNNLQWEVQEYAKLNIGKVDVISRDHQAPYSSGQGYIYVNGPAGVLTSDNIDSQTTLTIKGKLTIPDGTGNDYYNGMTLHLDLGDSESAYKIVSYNPLQPSDENSELVVEGDASFDKKYENLAGTVDTTQGSNLITGNGTSFSNFLVSGDVLRIEGDEYTVSEVTDDTTLTLSQPANSTVSAADFQKRINPDYQILPTIEIEGDGEGLLAIPIMGPVDENGFYGIDEVKVLNGGLNYTRANASFKNSTYKQIEPLYQPKFEVIIPPPGYHGSDFIKELGGYFIMINTKFKYDEGGFTVDNDYRQISLIKDPKLYSDDSISKKPECIQSKSLIISSHEGIFKADDILTQDNGATGIIVDIIEDYSETKKAIRVVPLSGEFVTGNVGIESSPSGGEADTIDDIIHEDLKKSSGDIIFVEQRTLVKRDKGQVEDIKIILEF